MARASRSTRPKIRMQSDSSIAVSSPPLAESGSGTSFNGGTGKCLFLTEESRYGVVDQDQQESRSVRFSPPPTIRLEMESIVIEPPPRRFAPPLLARRGDSLGFTR